MWASPAKCLWISQYACCVLSVQNTDSTEIVLCRSMIFKKIYLNQQEPTVSPNGLRYTVHSSSSQENKK